MRFWSDNAFKCGKANMGVAEDLAKSDW